MLMLEAIGEKQYRMLGRLVIKKYPELAKELLASYMQHQPLEMDHTKLKNYFTIFCRTQGVKEEDYRGPLFKSEKVSKRRLFTACMMHLYCPQVYHDVSLSRTGFVLAMSETLRQKPANVSSTIREVVLWENRYDDFASTVEQSLEKILNNDNKNYPQTLSL